MSDPWSEIPPSTHPGFNNVRRVEAEYPIDFRRGKDFNGRYIFVLEGSATADQLPKPPKIAGIDVAAVFGDTGSCHLTLTLLDSSSIDTFRSLCNDLLSSTEALERGDNGAALLIVLVRLLEWQKLLQRRLEQILSTQEVIGLFGELLLLRDCLLPAAGVDAAAYWRGPFGDEQDFVVGNWIIEAKTRLSTADQRIPISSEAQLDTSSGNILLCYQTIGATSASDINARSLNGIVDEIARQLDRAGARLNFEMGLLNIGYVRRSEYDEKHWVVASRRMFSVTGNFPRITPPSLPQGIDRVSYEIRADACLPFEIDLNSAMEQIFGGRP